MSTAVRADSADLIGRLGEIPAAMRDRQQWLVWRFVKKSGQDKPSKMPYYANGNLRGWPNGQPPRGADGKRVGTEAQPQVDQGHELDRAALVTLEQAAAALRSGRWEGLGFAFLPGDGLIGIDVDRAIDQETGEMAAHCRDIIANCGSYTELSPSGTGVHVICTGTTETFKDNDVGVEVFCGRQFFTVTAQPMGECRHVNFIGTDVLDWLRRLVKGDKAAQRQEQRAALPSPVSQAYESSKQAMRYCMAALERAVQHMRNTTEGGRNNVLNEEAFGLARLVASGGISEIVIRAALGDAARAVGLADAEINATMDSAIRSGLSSPFAIPQREPRRALSPSPSHKAEPPSVGGEVAAEGLQEPSWLADIAPPAAVNTVATTKPSARAPAKGGKGSEAAGEQDESFWARVDVMTERFYLVEASDQALDTRDMTFWRVSDMRLRFGQAVVKAWLARVAEERARSVNLKDVLFEPGLKVLDHQINLFTGLDLKPIPCEPSEVEPMLALLRHLCSETTLESGGDAEYGCDEVMHWVLRWQALPIQQLGKKMQTACIFHGEQGTGKNLYWDAWRDLFGVYGITVGQTELEDKFNGWVSRKMAIIGDEVVSRQEMYHNKNRVKMLVTTEDRFPIRGMMKETRWESNHANVVFLSNESQPLPLEERDRRYMVVFTPLEATPALYEAVRDFKAAGGLGKWLYYLQTYPLDGFDAHTKPLMTQAKKDLIELTWKAPQRFMADWIDGYLDMPVRVCSAEQLYRAFRRWCDRSGEKWPESQANFTNAVKRWVNQRVKRKTDGTFDAPAMTYKVIKLKDSLTDLRKAVRCWVPSGCGAPDGVTEGEWANDSVKTFDQDIERFLRHTTQKDVEE